MQTRAVRRSIIYCSVILLMITSVLFGATRLATAQTPPPAIASDLADYNPGGWVTLTGTAWLPNATVHLVVNDDVGQTWSRVVDVPVAADGAIKDVFQLPNWFVATYFVTATGDVAGSASMTFTDANSSADLDQCANDPLPSLSSDGCNTTASEWVNGNLGASKAVYFEGDSIPYRLTFGSLSLASHTVTIEWDTTKSGTHALDYLTSYNASVLNANPCLGVSGCDPATFSTFAIPADPQVTGAGVNQVPGNFILFGGTITGVSAYSYPKGTGFTGDMSARITITFTASRANPVLAWGGHISTRKDWGMANSAVAISGSPYHTSLVDLDGSGGSQDRSLSADAVIFPGSITVVKDATPNGDTSFGFTGSPAPLTSFSLVDDGTSANTQVFSNITTFQTYAVNESTIPTNWGFDSVACSVTTPNGGSYTTSTTTVNITMKEGENWICTYLDSLRVGTLTVIKHVVNDNGGTLGADQWFIHVKSGGAEVSGSPQAGSESGTSYTLAGGTYTVSETGGLSGNTFTGFSGDCDSSGNVTVVNGQNKTCTLTNDDIAPVLHLRKVVVNDNGGTATEANFTLTADGTDTNDLSGATPVDSGTGLKADTWALSETGPAGYSASAWSCVGGTQNDSNITLGIGQEATCTITNDDIQPKLTLVKTVNNKYGGTLESKDFPLFISGAPATSGVAVGLTAGDYTASETQQPGYTASVWGGDCAADGKVTLAVGDNKTCTITNSDVQPQLIVIKHVINDNGGTATAADFTLGVTGSSPSPASFPGLESPGTTVTLSAGSYSVSETGPAGYTASYSADCSGTIAVGESKTCTVTNDDQTAHLKLVKTVTNDNGGTAAATDFTLSATGPTSISGAGGVDSDINAGSYALSETGPAGYTAGDWSCNGGTQTGSSIALALGESATCTIDNDDIQPQLIVIKHVINDNGGTATAADFTMDITGNNPSQTGFPGVEFPGVTVGIDAGAYSVSELRPSTYSLKSASAGCSGTIAVGETKTCTITNDDIAPVLHLRKVVVNDNGGTATEANFTLTANGTGSNDLSGTTPVDSGTGLQADTWALSETGPAGYTASAWSCVGSTQNDSNITLSIGQEATCTITNDDIAPVLHLRKVVVNDNGGTATEANFTLTANGTGANDLSGATPVDSGAGLQADTWALSETSLPGYSASVWVCNGGTQTGSNITLSIGQEATCTITNDDQPGTIVVKKIVKPTTSSTNFNFTTTGTGYSGFSLAGGQENSQTLNAGSYTVTELVPLGWVLTGIGGSSDPSTPYNCTVTGSGGSTGMGDLTTQTATIALKNGDTVTCVFENTGQGVTRTQGFWATHPQLANSAWFGGTAFGHTFPGVAATAGIGDNQICGRPVDTLGKVMGAFWSDIPKKTDGKKRTSLDQSRMQLLQQLIAAELNASAFGSAPSGGMGKFAEWESALCGTNIKAIQTAQKEAASFNTQGDSNTFTPGTSADSKTARTEANKAFWDMIKP